MSEPPTPERVSAATGEPRSHRSGWLLLALLAALVTLGLLHGGGAVARASADWLEAGSRSLGNFLLGDVRVGIQVGHLDARAHPEEHARLRVSTGAAANGVTEVEVNMAVATALRDILVAHGIEVDLLPASVPPRYRADAFVSLHADSSPDPTRRGYKSAHSEPPRTPQERILKQLVDRSYFAATGLPDDDANVSGNMLQYYAFDASYRHAVSPVTPSILIEMGYISNADDLAMLRDPRVPARAIAGGVIAYLRDAGRLPAP